MPAAKEKTAHETFLKHTHITETGCWVWCGILDHAGYGVFTRGKIRRAHRYSYTHYIGEMGAGLDLDHLCRNPSCVNPMHLEPVTHRENMLRGRTFAAANAAKTHCLKGHLLSGENLYSYKGSRRCRVCRAEHAKANERRHRKVLLSVVDGKKKFIRVPRDANWNL